MYTLDVNKTLRMMQWGGGGASRAERDGLDTVSDLALALAQEMATCHLPRAAAGPGEIIVINWLTKRTSQETYIYCVRPSCEFDCF